MGSQIVLDFFGVRVRWWNLAENGESGAHATFVSSVFEIRKFLVDMVAHFVGKGDEVELAVVESFVDDRVIMMDIDIIFVGDESDFSGFFD